MQPISLSPIGIVRTTATEADFKDWKKLISEIHINEDYLQGLQGLDDWSHIVVVFSLHQTEFHPESDMLRHPKNRQDMPELGIFAQRSHLSPNKIGLTAVELLEVEGNVLRVKGLDALDSTPVLDIKPYAPIYDGVREALVPAWFIRLMQP